MRKEGIKKIIFFLLSLLLFAVIYFIPIKDMPRKAQVALSIFSMGAFLWITEAIPLHITSFMILFFLSIFLVPIMKVKYTYFFAPFFSGTIILFLGGFTLARAMKVYKLDEKFADFILKKAGVSPKGILFGFIFTTAFLSMWMSNTATTALMMAVALTIFHKLDPDDGFRKALALGIPFSANIGGMGTPIGTPPNAIAIGLLREKGIEVSFVKWMVIALPIELLLLFFMWFLLLKLFPPKRKSIQLSVKDTSSNNAPTMITLITLVITVLLWLTSSIHHIKDAIIAIIPVIILFGTGTLGKEDFYFLGWDILMLMGGGLALGLAAQKSGLNAWLIQASGISSLSPYWVFVGFVALSGIITNFMSNTSTAALIIPIAMAISGVSPTVMAVGIALTASSSMLLPISTPPNAIAYGSGVIKVKDMFKAGIIITLLCILLLVTLFYGIIGYVL